MKLKPADFFALIILGLSINCYGVMNGIPINTKMPIANGIVRVGNTCTGVLIKPDVVLTASHCNVKNGVEGVVWLPSKRESCGFSSFTEVVSAPRLQTARVDEPSPDLSLLHLERPLCGTPVHFAWRMPQPKEEYSAAGFSENKYLGSKINLVIREKTFAALEPIYTDHDSAGIEYFDPHFLDRLKDFLIANEKYILLTEPKSSKQMICPGDSGGPLYRVNGDRVDLYGVTISGLTHPTKGLCELIYVPVFIPIVTVRQWIENTLQLWGY